MKALPDNVSAYTRTPYFDEKTVPDSLLNAYQTQPHIWGKIVILEGQLKYTIRETQPETITLNKHHFGIVEPAVTYQLEPIGSVRFYVEFYQEADS